jgi:hypothetical protein
MAQLRRASLSQSDPWTDIQLTSPDQRSTTMSGFGRRTDLGNTESLEAGETGRPYSKKSGRFRMNYSCSRCLKPRQERPESGEYVEVTGENKRLGRSSPELNYLSPMRDFRYDLY